MISFGNIFQSFEIRIFDSRLIPECLQNKFNKIILEYTFQENAVSKMYFKISRFCRMAVSHKKEFLQLRTSIPGQNKRKESHFFAM